MVTIKQAAKMLPNTHIRRFLSSVWHGYKWAHQFAYFKIKYPGVKLLRIKQHHAIELKKMGFRSQFGQDHFLNELFFQNKKNGFFVDIGANDPEYNSNSYFFENSLAWRGLAIEPQKKFQAEWKRARRAEFINVGVGAKEEQKNFIEYDSPNAWEDQLSCVVGLERPEDEKLQGKVYEIPIRPLNDILLERKIYHIDLLSIDVEGYEEEVLKGINFNKVRPHIVLLENMAYLRGREDLRSRMKENGYKLIYRIWTTDDVYVDSRRSAA